VLPSSQKVQSIANITEREMTIFQWRTQEFCSGGRGSTIQLRTEDRENGDLGAAAP